MGKLIIVVIVIAVLAVAGAGLAYKALGSPVVSAQLMVNEGLVEVDSGNGFASATDGMTLSLSDKVRTGPDGDATVVLFETILIDLEPSTEVSLEKLSKQNVHINQASGSTWNKFVKVVGVSSLTVQTPTTVATVRGTFFGMNDERVLLSDGEVEVAAGGESQVLKGTQKAQLKDGKPRIVDLTSEDRDVMSKRKEKMTKRLMRLREKELDKHKTALKVVERTYGSDNKEIRKKLQELDDNNEDIDSLTKKAPVRSEALRKIAEITKEIRKNKREEQKSEQAPSRQENLLEKNTSDNELVAVRKEKDKREDEKSEIESPQRDVQTTRLPR